MRTVCLTNETQSVPIATKVEVAQSSLRRAWGLLGRKTLAQGSGLWIGPSSGVHTVGMMFPIDVIGLNRDRKVERLWPNLAPFRMTALSIRVKSVVELPAGTIKSCGVQIGDQLSLEAPVAESTTSGFGK